MSSSINTPERRKKESWRLDKNIPITLIVVLVIQTGTFVVWAAKLDASVTDHERRLVVGEAFDRDTSRANLEMCQRLARVEEKVGSSLTYLERIDNSVRSITSTSGK